ncbi:unnamed protein product [Brachionus calyciflorus]|uniref:Uncharacterized protein n=1 Tax=Brachionus calyciflorus TaxID=104777 RepID=A0A813XD93_9BILA|nr:unnamed protein product [Brachionus calyciflorus]
MKSNDEENFNSYSLEVEISESKETESKETQTTPSLLSLLPINFTREEPVVLVHKCIQTTICITQDEMEDNVNGFTENELSSENSESLKPQNNSQISKSSIKIIKRYSLDPHDPNYLPPPNNNPISNSIHINDSSSDSLPSNKGESKVTSLSTCKDDDKVPLETVDKQSELIPQEENIEQIESENDPTEKKENKNEAVRFDYDEIKELNDYKLPHLNLDNLPLDEKHKVINYNIKLLHHEEKKYIREVLRLNQFRTTKLRIINELNIKRKIILDEINSLQSMINKND